MTYLETSPFLKIVERFCLLLWIISITMSVSCLGLACMVSTINEFAAYFHWTQPKMQVAFAGQSTGDLFIIGLLALPVNLFIWYFGTKYLHFHEHDDGIDYEDED